MNDEAEQGQNRPDDQECNDESHDRRLVAGPVSRLLKPGPQARGRLGYLRTVTRQHWPSTTGTARGRVLLLHGLSSIADSWWRMGPALAEDGWDVMAVDQAGHGGRPVSDPVSPARLAEAVRDQVPSGPDVLIGHSLGALTALALLDADPGWARRVILEDPPTIDQDGTTGDLARSIRADHALLPGGRADLLDRVRRDCPRWDERDVHWAVEGIARMNPEPFARWLEGDADMRPQFQLAERVLSLAETPFLIVAPRARPFGAGGSALVDPDRAVLERKLAPDHLITIDGGHCLHRDAPAEWLAAVRGILGD